MPRANDPIAWMFRMNLGPFMDYEFFKFKLHLVIEPQLRLYLASEGLPAAHINICTSTHSRISTFSFSPFLEGQSITMVIGFHRLNYAI